MLTFVHYAFVAATLGGWTPAPSVPVVSANSNSGCSSGLFFSNCCWTDDCGDDCCQDGNIGCCAAEGALNGAANCATNSQVGPHCNTAPPVPPPVEVVPIDAC
jgi:hypothetical protein